MAFRFVDQITDFEPRQRAAARFTVPPGLSELPPSLIAEAVGQLAAWVAMEGVDFRARPVAALAREIAIGESAHASDVIEMTVEIGKWDQDAVLYSGLARVGSVPVLELRRCVGPMLPMEGFDDPKAVRALFGSLRAGSAAAQDFSGGVDLAAQIVQADREPGEYNSVEVTVPAGAALFADHFPRKPVVPGTLLLDLKTRLALELAREASSGSSRLWPTMLRDMKLKAFLSPDQTFTVGVQLLSAKRAAAEVLAYAQVDGKRVSTTRVELDER